MNEIDTIILKRMIGQAKIIDIRIINSGLNDSIPTATNVPNLYLLANPEKYLDPNETYYLICQSGSVSRATSMTLNMSGYKTISVIGGVDAFYNHYNY